MNITHNNAQVRDDIVLLLLVQLSFPFFKTLFRFPTLDMTVNTFQTSLGTHMASLQEGWIWASTSSGKKMTVRRQTANRLQTCSHLDHAVSLPLCVCYGETCILRLGAIECVPLVYRWSECHQDIKELNECKSWVGATLGQDKRRGR